MCKSRNIHSYMHARSHTLTHTITKTQTWVTWPPNFPGTAQMNQACCTNLLTELNTLKPVGAGFGRRMQ